MKKILLIVNPRAGKMKLNSNLFNILYEFSKGEYIPTVHITTAREDATDFVAAHGDEHDIIVCCGGDGTLNETIAGAMQLKTSVPIGYIPAGTTNDLANSLGLPKSISGATKAIMEGTPKLHDIGMLSCGKFFTYIASFGAFTKTSYSTPQSLKNTFGHFAYTLNGLTSLSEIKGYHAKIHIDGKLIEGNYIFGAVTNATSVGGVMKLDADLVNFNDGIFEIVLVKEPDNLLEYPKIISDLVRKQYDEEYVNLYHGSKIEFACDDEIGWTVDGEFAGSLKDVTIENLHGKISLIR